MSHWKQFTNDVLTNTNMDILSQAVAKMGITLDTTIKNISNPWGSEKVDMGFRKNGQAIALGFRNNNGKLELVGDFYGTGLVEEDFINQVSQHYTVEDIVRKVRTSMWTLENEPTVNANGEVEMYVYQYA